MKKLLSVLLAICMMVGMVTVLASADEPKSAYYYLPVASNTPVGVTLQGFSMTEDANVAHYYTTNENGFAVAEGASDTNYNIMVTFMPDEPLTVYLKDANINAPRNIGKGANSALRFGYLTNDPATSIVDFDVLIVVLSDSTLKNSWATYDEEVATNSTHGEPVLSCKTAGDLTIAGPGKLDLWSDCITPIGCIANLTIQDITLTAALDITHKWSDFHTIEVPETLTIDNATVKATNNYTGVLRAKDIVIQNGSDVDLFAEIDIESRITMNASDSYTIDNSKLLINSNGAHAVTKATVNLVGVNALGGTKEANAKAFKPGRQEGYWYLIAGPDVVIETDPPETVAPETTQAVVPTRPTTASTDPAATQPAATQPAATQPAASKPAATEPAATEPAATEPAATKPTASKPVSTGDATWLYIVLGAFALVGIGAFVFIIVKTQKISAMIAKYADDETEAVAETETTEDAE